SLSVSSLGVGSHSLRAVYNGDANYLASTSAGKTEVVNPVAVAGACAFPLSAPTTRIPDPDYSRSCVSRYKVDFAQSLSRLVRQKSEKSMDRAKKRQMALAQMVWPRNW